MHKRTAVLTKCHFMGLRTLASYGKTHLMIFMMHFIYLYELLSTFR